MPIRREINCSPHQSTQKEYFLNKMHIIQNWTDKCAFAIRETVNSISILLLYGKTTISSYYHVYIPWICNLTIFLCFAVIRKIGMELLSQHLNILNFFSIETFIVNHVCVSVYIYLLYQKTREKIWQGIHSFPSIYIWVSVCVCGYLSHLLRHCWKPILILTYIVSHMSDMQFMC